MNVRLLRSDAYMEKVETPNLPDEKILGPFEWVQVTYNLLRSDDDVVLAHFDPVLDLWVEEEPESGRLEGPTGWTDFVIYNEPQS